MALAINTNMHSLFTKSNLAQRPVTCSNQGGPCCISNLFRSHYQVNCLNEGLWS